MGQMNEYKGFSISPGVILEGKLKYVGLIARKPGIKIESPKHERYNRKELYNAIKEFTNKK